MTSWLISLIVLALIVLAIVIRPLIFGIFTQRRDRPHMFPRRRTRGRRSTRILRSGWLDPQRGEP